MTTVVVVHPTATPNRPLLVALCDEHTALLYRAARIDELVGFSTILDCEACALTSTTAQESHEIACVGPAPHLHAVPKRA
jgi:hypothetical protein